MSANGIEIKCKRTLTAVDRAESYLDHRRRPVVESVSTSVIPREIKAILYTFRAPGMCTQQLRVMRLKVVRGVLGSSVFMRGSTEVNG